MRIMDYSLTPKIDYDQLLLLLFVSLLQCLGKPFRLYPIRQSSFDWTDLRRLELINRFGWSGAYPEVHWFVPIFFTGFFGMSPSSIRLFVRRPETEEDRLTGRNRSIHPIPNHLCLSLRFISRGISFGVHTQRFIQIIFRSVCPFPALPPLPNQGF